MGNKLFLFKDRSAKAMAEHEFALEYELQSIIENNPEILIRENAPENTRLFLVKREQSVQDKDVDGNNSYSLDLLLLDQDGVPVLVEVKRSTDTRIRREVVGQMLDYSSRVSSWNVAELRQAFVNKNPAEDERYYSDEFWAVVSTNLKAENIKLVFAADKIPETLEVIIDFMNRQMPHIEIYGVEIRQYITGNDILLSVNSVGDALSDEQKIRSQSVNWDYESFVSFMENNGLHNIIPAFRELSEYAESLGLLCSYGKGAKQPTFSAKFSNLLVFFIWCGIRSGGTKCDVNLDYKGIADYLGSPEWDGETICALMKQFVQLDPSRYNNLIWDGTKYTNVSLDALASRDAMDVYKASLKALVDALKDTASNQ